jgi:hypothetical protein
MRAILAWILRRLCDHDTLLWVRNIYGDEINACGGKRSIWRCWHCGAVVYGNDTPAGTDNPPADSAREAER